MQENTKELVPMEGEIVRHLKKLEERGVDNLMVEIVKKIVPSKLKFKLKSLRTYFNGIAESKTKKSNWKNWVLDIEELRCGLSNLSSLSV